MVKQAPTPLRLITMAGFALSCFALLMLLWLSFGGPTPLKAKGYRFDVAFQEATQLADEADVRVAGVTVGKVRELNLDGPGNATLATLELKPQYAPIASDAKAILRRKTLLGETYVELTTGSQTAKPLPDGGTLSVRNVEPTVELDEILDTLDPYTRDAFRTWQQTLAQAVDGRGQDLNDTLGNLPAFASNGADLLQTLDRQRSALKGVVRDTGVVFAALTQREGQLRALVENGDSVFSAIQRERESFAKVFQLFPTFLNQSRLTFNRLGDFSRDTRPLVRELRPAFDKLEPTLQGLGDLGPDLQRMFRNFSPLITLSEKSLPATRQILDGLRPVLGQLDPWLGEVNPVLDWVGQNQTSLTDMFANLGYSTAAKGSSSVPGVPGHYLRQIGPIGTETVGVYPTRLPSNRGNAYINPLSLAGKEFVDGKAIAAFDCNNGGERPPGGVPAAPACRIQKGYNGGPKYPHVDARDYGTP